RSPPRPTDGQPAEATEDRPDLGQHHRRNPRHDSGPDAKPPQCDGGHASGPGEGLGQPERDLPSGGHRLDLIVLLAGDNGGHDAAASFSFFTIPRIRSPSAFEQPTASAIAAPVTGQCSRAHCLPCSRLLGVRVLVALTLGSAARGSGVGSGARFGSGSGSGSGFGFGFGFSAAGSSTVDSDSNANPEITIRPSITIGPT